MPETKTPFRIRPPTMIFLAVAVVMVATAIAFFASSHPRRGVLFVAFALASLHPAGARARSVVCRNDARATFLANWPTRRRERTGKMEVASGAARAVPGVVGAHARGRWTGRTLRIDVDAYLDEHDTTGEATRIARAIEAAVYDAVPRARQVRILFSTLPDRA
jgi:hypothetical protein